MLVALLALVAAAEPSADDFMERVNRPVALTVPGMDRVQVLPDRPYGPGDKAHRFDAYLPGRPGSPVVLLIHGGVGADVPVRPKDWGIYRSWGRLLAASGYVAIAFNHRLGFPDPMLAEADQDLTAMLETVYSTASKGSTEYGLKVIEVARTNTNTYFDFVEKLFGVKSPSELVELTTAHSRTQFETATAQGKELAALVAGRGRTFGMAIAEPAE